MQKRYFDNQPSLKEPLWEIDLETRKLRADIAGVRKMDECFGKYGTGWVWDNEDGTAMTLEEAVKWAKKEMPDFKVE